MLEPTSPLTVKKDVRKALLLLKKKYNHIDSVAPVVNIDKFDPMFSIKLKRNLFLILLISQCLFNDADVPL